MSALWGRNPVPRPTPAKLSASRFEVIGITYPPQKLSEVRGFTRRLRVNYRVALGTKEMKALFTSSEALPITTIIGKDGRVRDTIEGILLPEEFEQLIKPLLSRPANISNKE